MFPHLTTPGCAAAAAAAVSQALVDSPTETRRVVNFKRLALTDLKVDIKRVPGKKELTQAFTEAGGPQDRAGRQGERQHQQQQ